MDRNTPTLKRSRTIKSSLNTLENYEQHNTKKSNNNYLNPPGDTTINYPKNGEKKMDLAPNINLRIYNYNDQKTELVQLSSSQGKGK